MISYEAFHDELTKIAKEDKGGPYVTKDRLKRLAVTMGATGLGSGLGYATGTALERALKKRGVTIPHRLGRYVPAATIGLGALAATMRSRKERAADKYIGEGNGGRPK